jgi:hypothetical protein
MKTNHGALYEISIDGIPRSYRDRKDIALQSAQFLKSRNPTSVVKLKDLSTGEEIVVACESAFLLSETLPRIAGLFFGTKPAVSAFGGRPSLPSARLQTGTKPRHGAASPGGASLLE